MRDTVTHEGLSTPVGAGGFSIGPSRIPQPVTNNSAMTEPNRFNDVPSVSRPIPRRSETGWHVGRGLGF